tara:strand:+ start:287 stop:679 length:393 start_codon:yes stop_codon:yes gene_type:complete
MATKKSRSSKYLDRHESDVLKINKRQVHIPKGFHPTGVVKEQFDDDGKKTIIIECQYNKDHVKDFIKKVEDAIDASETDLEKERICRKYSGQEDYCLLKSALLNYDTPKHKLDYSFIEALKAKGYYRGNN